MESRFQKEIEETRNAIERIQQRIEELQTETQKPQGESADSKANLVKRIYCLESEVHNLYDSMHMMAQYLD